MYHSSGISLVELLVTLCILAIICVKTITSYAITSERHQIIAAVEALKSHLQLARIESIKRNITLRLSFVADNSKVWSYGITDEVSSSDTRKGCDPTITNPQEPHACTIEYDNNLSQDYDGDSNNTDPILYHYDQSDFSNISMSGKTRDYPTFSGGAKYATFNPIRGTSSAGSVDFISDHYELRLVLSMMGRIRSCSPDPNKKVPGHESC